ncbi:MAG: hypothetical protein RIS76_3334 [Verrucomicrobiota bacterium]|jgi:UDP-2,3-diacylglucosamine pyrophosphatase LpxH
MRYRSIWISDVHLGSRHAQTELLLDFLRHHQCRHLYLVGDIVDGWELRRRWLWDADSNTVIQKILRIHRKETRVTYICGNHDEFLQHFVGLSIGGVRVVDHAIHVGADRRRYLVIHGHQLDGLVQFNRLLERVGSRLYDFILTLNTHFNRLRRRMGFGYWSVSSYLKQNTKSAVRYITGFEDGMVRLAQEHRVQGVICGHIHRAEQRQIHGLKYLNCGDWVESCTALVEDFDGQFQILRWHERRADSKVQDPLAAEQAVQKSEEKPSSKFRQRPPAGSDDAEPELAGLF